MTIILFYCVSMNAHASELNFGSISCAQYLVMIESLVKEKRMASASGILMWLYGYHSARIDSTLYSQPYFRQFAQALKKECIADTSKPLMDVIEKISPKNQ